MNLHRKVTNCFALLIIVALVSVFATGEDIPEGSVNPSFRAQSLEEIEEVYMNMTAHPANGQLNRNSYFIWALSNYLFDSMISERNQEKMLSCRSVEDYRKLYAPSLEGIVKRIRKEDPVVEDLAEIILNSSYRTVVEFIYRKDEDRKERLKQVEEFLHCYTKGEKKNMLHNPCIRQALAVMVTWQHWSHYREYVEKKAGFGMFVLAGMETNPIGFGDPEAAGRDDYRKFMIYPVAEKGSFKKEAGKVKLASDFHVMTTFTENIPLSCLMMGRVQNLHISELLVCLRDYFTSPGFLRSTYGDSEPGKDKLNWCKTMTMGLNSALIADHRKIHVEKDFTISRDIKRLCDPKDEAYSYITDLMVMNDHAEFPNGLSAIRELEKFSPKEIKKYNDYLAECEVLLAACYPKTVKTKLKAQLDEPLTKKSAEIMTPDFNEKPELHLLYIPRPWLRHACYYGLSVILFQCNLIGFGDLEVHFPSGVVGF